MRGRRPRTEPARTTPAEVVGEPGPAVSDTSEDTARGVLRAMSVIAPVTLVTALAYYFGWTATHASAAYLGIDESVLGFTTQDYVLRSITAIFWPLCIGLVVGAVALRAHAIVSSWPAAGDSRPRATTYLRVTVVVLGASGALLLGYGIAALQNRWLFRGFSLAPLSMTLAVALLAYAVGLRSSRRGHGAGSRAPSLTVVLISLLVAVGLFWQVAEWATAVGVGQTQALVATLRSRPSVTLFSTRSLALSGPGVTQTRLADPDGAYQYRYTGLRLLFRTDERYFLLSEQWDRRNGRLFVIDDTHDVRFEFAPGSGGGS